MNYVELDWYTKDDHKGKLINPSWGYNLGILACDFYEYLENYIKEHMNWLY